MNEASYISLLDMQRVMQRVLKRSGLPVWHTLGFNPHIYMTFACPLSLGQESQCERVDVKTEAETPDFAQWQTALNAIMPTGIEVYRVEPVKMKADAIAYACYRIRYPADAAEKLAQYNALDSVPVEKKSKRGVKMVEMKEYVPTLELETEGESVSFAVCLPASQDLNLNPSLLTAALEAKFGVPAANASILRTEFLTADKQKFVYQSESENFCINLPETLAFTGGLCYPIKALVSAETTAGLMTHIIKRAVL